jgi:hypothetical protein
VSYQRIGAARIRGIRGTYLPPTTDTYTDGIDWIAVERAIRGDLPAEPLTHDELREAALGLVRSGVSRKSISVQLCVYERRIRDWEAEAGLLPPEDLCSHTNCRRAKCGLGLCASHLQAYRLREREWQLAVAELEVAA